MKKPRTLAVRHPRDPGRPTVIRAENYDPDVHVLWAEGPQDDPAHGVGEFRKDPGSIPVERGHLPAGDPSSEALGYEG